MWTSTMIPAALALALAAGTLAQPAVAPVQAPAPPPKKCSLPSYPTISGTNHPVQVRFPPDETQLAALNHTPVTLGPDGGLLVGAAGAQLKVTLSNGKLSNDKGVQLSFFPNPLPPKDKSPPTFTPRFVNPASGTGQVEARQGLEGSLILIGNPDELSFFSDWILCRNSQGSTQDSPHVWKVLLQAASGNGAPPPTGCYDVVLQLPGTHCDQ